MKLLVKVCEKYKLKCGNKPFPVEVGTKKHLFCCEKGYRKSIQEFSKTVAPIK
jgi:hypothetical protein